MYSPIGETPEMFNENDMIEINLNTECPSKDAQPIYERALMEPNVNVQSNDELAAIEQTKMKYVKINCLRQIYCPNCQQRLQEDNVRVNRFASFGCLFGFPPWYQCCMKRTENRKVTCDKCGYQLGFL